MATTNLLRLRRLKVIKLIDFTINDSSANAVSVKVIAENQPLKSSSSKTSISSKSSSIGNSSSKKSRSSSSQMNLSIKCSSSKASFSNLMISSSTVKNSGNKGHRGIPERAKRSSSNLNFFQESSSSGNLIEISSQQDYSSATSTMPKTESSEVTVKGSSQKAILVSSTVGVPVFQGSSSRWTMSSKATLVSRTEMFQSKVHQLWSSVINNGILDNGVSSNQSTTIFFKRTSLKKVAIESSSSSKWEKNGKILPQIGEEKEFMDVLSIVGLIMVGGVVGIEIIKHRHN